MLSPQRAAGSACLPSGLRTSAPKLSRLGVASLRGGRKTCSEGFPTVVRHMAMGTQSLVPGQASSFCLRQVFTPAWGFLTKYHQKKKKKKHSSVPPAAGGAPRAGGGG